MTLTTTHRRREGHLHLQKYTQDKLGYQVFHDNELSNSPQGIEVKPFLGYRTSKYLQSNAMGTVTENYKRLLRTPLLTTKPYIVQNHKHGQMVGTSMF